MHKHPTAFQKFIHRFLMLKPVSAVLSVVLHHLDKVILDLTNGKHTGTALVGLSIIQLTTTGAKSGEKRTMPLASFSDGERIALIASNFGGKTNPGWYHNLKANPHCTVQINGRTMEYIAREAEGEERGQYWKLAVSHYAGYEKYKERAAPRRVPVMLLEPLK